MHGFASSGFTWGNTASSAGCVLPSDERPPYLWWAASTPCTSVYVPVFVDALGQVAEQQAGCARGAGAARVCAGELRQAGACARSLAGGRVVRWTFQRLLDVVKGDALGRAFTDRQPQVRAAFDPLETVWRAETHDLLARAAHERTQRGRDAAAEVLAAFTRRCVDEALATADRLLERFSRGLAACRALRIARRCRGLTPERRGKSVAASTGPEAARSLI